MNTSYEAKVEKSLEHLKMSAALLSLDCIAQQASAEKWSYSRFLSVLLEKEIEQRNAKKVDLYTHFANFPYMKSLEDFDFKEQPSIDKRLIDELATCRFVNRGGNLVFLGPPGVGKTHLAVSLGRKCIEQGGRVYFISAMDLAHKLEKSIEEKRLAPVMKHLNQMNLLIIDEVGYLKFSFEQASLLFQVICQRYQGKKSIIMTSNKHFSDWGSVFANDSIMAAAALDRLLHHSTAINVRGESYRLKEKRESLFDNEKVVLETKQVQKEL